MASIKISGILVLCTAVLCFANSYKTIYRKYERKHPNKNYVDVFEIFGTNFAPPRHTKSEKELNDFLARDAYKTDMNCTKTNGTDAEFVTRLPTTTPYPTITTTAETNKPTTPKPTIPRPPPTRGPNLNNLFTIRPTRPTIKPNPRENTNPDYDIILPSANPQSTPNVQVTKHPLTTEPPTIIIKETDDHPTTNRTTLIDIDEDLLGEKWPTTPTPPSTTTLSDDELYPEADHEDSAEDLENNGDEDYNEDNYSTISPEDENNHEKVSDDEDDPLEEYEEYDENLQPRRKRKRLAPLKRKHTQN